MLPYLVGMKQEQSDGNNDALVALGQQIRKIRELRDVSQEAFAAGANLGRSYFGGIERGERNVSAFNLMRIAAALGVEVGELFPPREVFIPLLNKMKIEK
jgi:transcriptional regulator with XRE-family HTH domain